MRPIRIEGCEHYSINEEGVVINTETGRVLKTDLNNCGYKRVTLWSKDQTRKRIAVHRLVAMHYLDNPQEYTVVDHRDGNKLHNHRSNLEWCSHKQNTKHAFDNGLRKGPNRLPDEVVRNIRRDQEQGVPSSVIRRRYNITQSRLNDVRRYYKDIS